MTTTILVTGATDGIGLSAAKQLAGAGHRVLLHGRSAAKLKTARTALGGNAEGYLADLSSLQDVKRLAEHIRAAHPRIDVLINNAGVFKTTAPLLPNGQDVRFVVNTLAPAVLTQALLPAIPAEGRVINLSSAAQAPVNPQALRGQAQVADMEAYAQSKLALTIWSQEMAKARPHGPVFIAVNPGSLLATKMVRDGFGVAGSDVSKGADILCRLALEPEFATKSGAYWDNDAGRLARPHSAARDPHQVRDVMDAIAEMTAER